MNKTPRLLAIILILSALGCSSTPLNLPSITTQATGAKLTGKVIWHDLVSEDPLAAERFYGELFGWTFKPLPGANYSLIFHGGHAVGGMIDARQFELHDNVSQWVVALSVADIDQAVTVVKQSGGQVLGGPVDAGDRGRLAVINDSQGAIFALLQTRQGDPIDREAAIGEYMWSELWTTDAALATAFYQQLVGYQRGSKTLADGSRYHYLESDGHPRVAILANPIAGLDPTWVSYLRVADTEAISAAVEGLGGKVLLASQINPVGGHLAIITDPSGAGFVIQTWDPSLQEQQP